MRNLAITSEQLAIGLVFVLIATLACLSPAQGDTWWLLRAGADIWETGSVPVTEAYSHTARGAHWPNHEWLTEAVFYGAHLTGGMPLLAALGALAVTLAWLTSYWLTRGTFEARLLLLIACVVPSLGSFALRPQLFTMFFFALTCWLLRYGRHRWLPLLILLWANFHGAVALGLVAIGAAGLVALIRERRWPWPFFWVGALSLGATLVTPLGLELWSLWTESPSSDLGQLVEWRPPGGSPALWSFWGVVAALPILAVWSRRQMSTGSWQLTAIALAVVPFALQAVRSVPIFLLAALPAVTGILADRRSAHLSLSEAPRRLNAGLLGGAVVLATAFVGLVWTRPPVTLGWSPFDEPTLEAIRSCEGPLYNTYADGGALMWFVPSQPIFIDSRQVLLPYPMELVSTSRQAEVTGEYEAIFARYQFNCALLPRDSPIVPRIVEDSTWRERHANAQWLVMERR